MASIRIEGVVKQYTGSPVLRAVDLAVAQGEMLALVGPSGCGKTTLLKTIAGLLEPTSGEIYFDNSRVTDLATRERGAVVVFQEHALFPHLSVAGNISFGLKMRGVSKALIAEKTHELMVLIQMEGMGHRFPRELSGGQRQRVAIARALAVSPKVLLLDEPFSNLDGALREAMREFIRRVQRKMGITCILVTHDIQDAMMTADRIAVLLDGTIRQCDSPRTIYKNPVNKAVADFFGVATYERVVIANGMARSRFGLLPVNTRYEGVADVLLRPECFTISSAGNVSGRVADAVFCGEYMHYRIQIGEDSYKVINNGLSPYAVGDEVFVDFELQDGCIFETEGGVRL